MSLPGHEEISERARQIWASRGYPSGLDDEIWFEAERQLLAPTGAHNAPSNPQGRGNGNSQSGTPATDPTPVERTSGGNTADKLTSQKKRSRAPDQPRRTGV